MSYFRVACNVKYKRVVGFGAIHCPPSVRLLGIKAGIETHDLFTVNTLCNANVYWYKIFELNGERHN